MKLSVHPGLRIKTLTTSCARRLGRCAVGISTTTAWVSSGLGRLSTYCTQYVRHASTIRTSLGTSIA